ncbi:MAG TPA: glycosyltransferase [Polyangiaceae bacterium]
MRVLFTSLRNTSHFLPLVPFIEACVRRGHQVAVAAPSDLAERVTKTGVEFFPFDHPGDAGLRPFWARLPTASPEEAKQIVIGGIFAGINAKMALPGLRKTVAAFGPSVIVRESQEYAAIVAAEEAHIPHARVAITLHRPEEEIFAVAAAAVDLHREELGLPLDPGGEALLREPALTLMPASLEYPEAAGTHVLRFRAMRRAPAPLPDWWGGDARPLVYVTLGTVAGGMDNRQEAYRAVAEAVSALPARVLFTVGNEFSRETLGEMPANVRVERFVPQDDVLPHAAAALCHGGSGSVLGALAAGVPLVVTPLFADQPDNAARVATTGAGLAVDGRALSVEELRGALSRVMAEDTFRMVARRFAAEIAALPPTDEAALQIERIARAENGRSGGPLESRR